MILSFHPDEVFPIDDTPFVNLPYNRYALKYEILPTASFLGGRLVNLFPTIKFDQGCLTAKETNLTLVLDHNRPNSVRIAPRLTGSS